jgi:circadian clock protein KaiC
MQYRSAANRAGKHTFRIGPGGLEVFPRIETLIPQPEAPLSSQIPSGIPGLDDLMGGGARQSDATLVTGPSGVGKTIFGLRWLVQGIERGESCLYVTFQDTSAQLTSVAASFGWDLAAYRDAGHLVISYVPMGDLDLDVLATSVRSVISKHQVSRVVIDSLSELAFAAREANRFAAYMRSLVGLVRAGGSSLLLTSETNVHGLPGNSLEGLLFLFDNTIDLRYVEEGSQIGRAVHVAKMRSRAHSMTLNSVTISNRGLEVGDVLVSVTGRLGWSALRSQGPVEPLEASHCDPGQTLTRPSERLGTLAHRRPRLGWHAADADDDDLRGAAFLGHDDPDGLVDDRAMLRRLTVRSSNTPMVRLPTTPPS